MSDPRRAWRVLRVIARLNTGGPARHVLILNGRLDPARFTSLLATGHVDPGQGEEEFTETDEGRRLADGVEVARIRGLGRAVKPTDDLRALRALVALCRRFRPHLVHTHTAKAGALGRVAAAIASRTPGGPPAPALVHTFHGHVFRGYFGRVGTAVTIAVERLLGRLTDRLVTLSPILRDEIAEALTLPRRHAPTIVQLGLDLDHLLQAESRRGELRGELGLPDATPIVGAVGRLVPIKAFDRLIEAFAAIPAPGGGPAPVLVIAGDGSERARLEELAAALGVADRVVLLGFRHDLDRLYAGVDVLAISSKNEGTPLAIIEAFAAATPVVATAVGGVPDLFRATGPTADGVRPCAEGALVADHRDRAGLARALGALLADPERRRVAGAAAREGARDRFAAARLVRDVEALYDELLARRFPRLAS